MPSGRVWRSTRFIPSPSRHSIPRRSLSGTQVSPRCHTPPRSPQSPRIQRELRDLIRRMSKENPLWGAPRILGELLKLGFEIDRVDGLQVHDPAPRTAVKELADIPAQSCRRNRSDRSLRGSNPDLRVPVCVCRGGSRTSTAALVWGDPASDRGVARTTDRGGIPVENGADLFGARQ